MVNLLRKGVPPCTIVIKLGTSSIVHETTHQPLLSTLSAVVETVVDLKRHGHKVVLVSSGAIGVGLKRMNIEKRPQHLSGKQALAAIGQGRLIALYDNLFGQLEQPIAQVLLTRGDISDRTRYLNAVNTFKELLTMGVVPIVNENDTVSVSEIKFGDNDTLSAITSSMVHADYLFLLTDVDGLYTSNPRKDPDARQIEVVDSVTAIRSEVSTTTLGSSLGTGGMETKLIAAEIATAAGVTTIITSSKDPGCIFRIIKYDVHTSPRQFRTVSDVPEYSLDVVPPTSGSASPEVLIRPPHTLFTASPDPMPDLKSWTSHTLKPSGSVIIDSGAYHVLAHRDSGGKLLSAGVVGVIGVFASGQAVRIVVQPRRGNLDDALNSYLRALALTRPATPATAAMVQELGGPSLSHEETLLAEKEEEISEDDVVEVGRGLANYNSAQIMAVKGMHSAFLPQVLGYADSEYVVENITVSVPPSPA
ncbi:glutamate 5-kinase [Crassisporium funariophilum]|nr:glutamate 5-kinase [Crassisporium funariophilum]